jgi:hypothetical protein
MQIKIKLKPFRGLFLALNKMKIAEFSEIRINNIFKMIKFIFLISIFFFNFFINLFKYINVFNIKFYDK